MHSHQFADLRDLFAKANEQKSGDQLAGIAARSERERVVAKEILADLPLSDILERPLVDPDTDEVSRLILEHHDSAAFSSLRSMTVGQFREFLLDETVSGGMLHGLQRAILPEMAAAAAKIMSNRDLIVVAAKIRNITRCRNTMGQAGVLGSRLQPNHPNDDLSGILLATLDGLMYGCGDAVIGVNPATDSVATTRNILDGLHRLITGYDIPTQACCLAHISTQLEAMERGAPVDLLFQSIAGTEAANRSFGISLAMLREARERVLEDHASKGEHWVGNDVMYFETGQGSALSADAHQGVDQLTLEARAYGVARTLGPFLVNSVVGFIGPEYLADERQIVRAGLEDHFMGKLLGLPMGCDVCYTNHAAADQNSNDNLLFLLACAGCNYVMALPCGDDVMLNYQSTSFHDVLAVRQLLGLKPAPEFGGWLERMGLFRDGAPAQMSNATRQRLLAQFESALAD